MDRGACWVTVHGVPKSGAERLSTAQQMGSDKEKYKQTNQSGAKCFREVKIGNVVRMPRFLI